MFKSMRGVYFAILVVILYCGKCESLVNLAKLKEIELKINVNNDVDNVVPESHEDLKKLPEERKISSHDEFEIEPDVLQSDLEETNYMSKHRVGDAISQRKTRKVPIQKTSSSFQSVTFKRRVLRQTNSLYPQLPTQAPPYTPYSNYNQNQNSHNPSGLSFGYRPNNFSTPHNPNSLPYNSNNGQYPAYNVTPRPYSSTNGQYPSYNSTLNNNSQFSPGYNNTSAYRPPYNQNGQYNPAYPSYNPPHVPNNTYSYNPSQRPPYSQPGQYPNNQPQYPNQSPNTFPTQRTPYNIPGQYPSYNTSRPGFPSRTVTNASYPNGSFNAMEYIKNHKSYSSNNQSFNFPNYPPNNFNTSAQRPPYYPPSNGQSYNNNNYYPNNPYRPNNFNTSAQRPPYYPPSNGQSSNNNNYYTNNPYPPYYSPSNGQNPSYNNTNNGPYNSPGYNAGPYNPSNPDRPPHQNPDQNHFYYPANSNGM